MANEVVVKFGLRALDAAKQRAREILALSKEAAKSVQDPAFRKEFARKARETAKATVADARERVRLQKLASEARVATSTPQLNRAFSKVNEVKEKGLAVAGAVAGFGSVTGGITTATSLLGLGPVGAAVAAVVAAVVPIVERRQAVRERAAARALELRIERALREADYRSRLEKDAVFRRREEERTRGMFLEGRAQQAGWHARSSRLGQVL